MIRRDGPQALSEDVMKRLSGGYAVLKPGGAYRREAVAFMRERLGEERFGSIMASRESFAEYPYVAAKLFLSIEDWNKYVWIEWHGSLDGYEPG